MTRYLKFTVTGIFKPLVFVVEKDEWDRVCAVFEQYKDGSLQPFVGFRTVDSRVIHVNTRFVLVYQSLLKIDSEELNTSLSAEGFNETGATFQIKGIDEPLHYVDIDEEELIDLTTGLESYDPQMHQFISFVDTQGCQQAIRADHLVLVEVRTNSERDNGST